MFAAPAAMTARSQELTWILPLRPLPGSPEVWPRSVRYSLRICLMRAIAWSTACSGLMPSATMRWIAFAQTCS